MNFIKMFDRHPADIPRTSHHLVCGTSLYYVPWTSPFRTFKYLFFLSKSRNRCVIQEQLLQFWRSPVAPAHLARLGDLQETLREPTQKWMIWWKKFFLHVYYCSLLEKQIFKSSKWGRPRDVYGNQLQDILRTKW